MLVNIGFPLIPALQLKVRIKIHSYFHLMSPQIGWQVRTAYQRIFQFPILTIFGNMVRQIKKSHFRNVPVINFFYKCCFLPDPVSENKQFKSFKKMFSGFNPRTILFTPTPKKKSCARMLRNFLGQVFFRGQIAKALLEFCPLKLIL